MYGINGVNNMTVYKVYMIGRNKVAEFTNVDDAFKYVNDHSYEIYSVYCGGQEVVVIEVI